MYAANSSGPRTDPCSTPNSNISVDPIVDPVVSRYLGHMFWSAAECSHFNQRWTINGFFQLSKCSTNPSIHCSYCWYIFKRTDSCTSGIRSLPSVSQPWVPPRLQAVPFGRVENGLVCVLRGSRATDVRSTCAGWYDRPWRGADDMHSYIRIRCICLLVPTIYGDAIRKRINWNKVVLK